MSYNITSSKEFSKHLKALSKKYPSIKNDFQLLIKSLLLEPSQGQPLGKNCFKIRWNITSKNAGKRGGARVITFVLVENNLITLLDVYDKADKDTLTDKELKSLLKQS
jgi:mRNA-degrading endonuclease RelE of RelBE toxin-antitoxin system